MVFGPEGYDGARIEEIAELADVSVGSIYRHFDGKRGMYLQLVDRALGLFTEYMKRSDDPELTPLQRVLAGGDAYLRFHLDHPARSTSWPTAAPGPSRCPATSRPKPASATRCGATPIADNRVRSPRTARVP